MITATQLLSVAILSDSGPYRKTSSNNLRSAISRKPIEILIQAMLNLVLGIRLTVMKKAINWATTEIINAAFSPMVQN
ncbi:MAG: hypothetical protein P1P82_17095 [Bacteroidales bacterium]|nr:hypothetical protein [Bacteroidales bacterium]